MTASLEVCRSKLKPPMHKMTAELQPFDIFTATVLNDLYCAQKINDPNILNCRNCFEHHWKRFRFGLLILFVYKSGYCSTKAEKIYIFSDKLWRLKNYQTGTKLLKWILKINQIMRLLRTRANSKKNFDILNQCLFRRKWRSRDEIEFKFNDY